MNSRLIPARALPLVVAAAVGLSGCSVLDAFGPSPDEEVLALARSAEADAVSWGSLADVRASQADALFAEVDRLCGTRDGQVPRSCEVERTGGVGTADAWAAAEELITGADEAPEESRDLLARQAIDLLVAAGAAGRAQEALTEWATGTGDAGEASEKTPEEDAELARRLLEAEYQASYGLTASQAWLATPQLAAAITAHELRISALRAYLEPTGEIPVSAVAYEFVPGTTPSDAVSAQAFVDNQEAATDELWAAAAGDAQGAGLRRLAVYAAVL